MLDKLRQNEATFKQRAEQERSRGPNREKTQSQKGSASTASQAAEDGSTFITGVQAAGSCAEEQKITEEDVIAF